MTKKPPKILELAKSKRDFFIIGERGVGKRHLARQIHVARGARVLVMIEGSSSHDTEIHEVLGQVAGDATLCIANIDSMVPHNQAEIASLLNRRGKNKKLTVIATAISADSLEPDIKERLKTFEQINIPPLRERLQELPKIVNAMVVGLCKTLDLKALEVDDATIAVLSRSKWPGNLRDLHATVGASIMKSHGDTLELAAEYLNEFQHLEIAIENIVTGKNFVLDEALDIIEKLLIQRALKQFRYNQSQTSEIIGLSEANFRYRLKKFNLPSVRHVE